MLTVSRIKGVEFNKNNKINEGGRNKQIEKRMIWENYFDQNRRKFIVIVDLRRN